MSHPVDRRQRFLIGQKKGRKRAKGYWNHITQTPEWFKLQGALRRNTTKLCSCISCGNPRRLFGELTMQEKMQNEQREIPC